MKKLVTYLFLAIFLISLSSAAIPYMGKCLQRFEQDSFSDRDCECELPNEECCTIAAFENGSCGLEYQNDNYCVPDGGDAWNGQGYECCEGSKPYLSPMHIGKTTCQPLSARLKGNLQYSPLAWLAYIAIVAAIISYPLIKRRKSRKK